MRGVPGRVTQFSSLSLLRPLLATVTKCLPMDPMRSMILTRKQVAFNSLSMELSEIKISEFGGGQEVLKNSFTAASATWEKGNQPWPQPSIFRCCRWWEGYRCCRYDNANRVSWCKPMPSVTQKNLVLAASSTPGLAGQVAVDLAEGVDFVLLQPNVLSCFYVLRCSCI